MARIGEVDVSEASGFESLESLVAEVVPAQQAAACSREDQPVTARPGVDSEMSDQARRQRGREGECANRPRSWVP